MIAVNLNSRIIASGGPKAINTAPTVTNFLEPDYVAVIHEQIEFYPHSLALVVEPFLLAQFDCEQGLPCDPTGRGYTSPADVNDYMKAYADTATMWAQTVTDANDAIYDCEPLVTDAMIDQAQEQAELDMERLEETEEYTSWQDDVEWMRRGC